MTQKLEFDEKAKEIKDKILQGLKDSETGFVHLKFEPEEIYNLCEQFEQSQGRIRELEEELDERDSVIKSHVKNDRQREDEIKRLQNALEPAIETLRFLATHGDVNNVLSHARLAIEKIDQALSQSEGGSNG